MNPEFISANTCQAIYKKTEESIIIAIDSMHYFVLTFVGTFISDVAFRVMTENKSLIKSYGIDLQFLADKLMEEKIINERQCNEASDECSGRTVDQRMNKLLEALMTSIKVNGEDFGIFLKILKEEDTKKSIKLAGILFNAYNES